MINYLLFYLRFFFVRAKSHLRGSIKFTLTGAIERVLAKKTFQTLEALLFPKNRWPDFSSLRSFQT